MNAAVPITKIRLPQLLSQAFLSISKPQCRAIHLYYSARAKQHESNHKIKAFTQYKGYKRPENVHLELLINYPEKQILKTTLDKVLREHMKEGHALLPLTKNSTTYYIEDLQTDRPIPRSKRQKQASTRGRGAKEAHLKIGVPNLHFKSVMLRTYNMLKENIIVEFQVHLNIKYNQSAPGLSDFNAIMNDPTNIHLRPEVILRAQPAEILTQIPPWTDCKVVAWVLGKPRVGAGDPRKLLNIRQKIQFDLEKAGAGIPLKEERKRLRREFKASPEYKSFTEKQKDAFALIRDKVSPAIETLVRRLSKPYDTPSNLIMTAKRMDEQLQIIAPLRKEDFGLYTLVQKSLTPLDDPPTLYRRIDRMRRQLETRRTLMQQDIPSGKLLQTPKTKTLTKYQMQKMDRMVADSNKKELEKNSMSSKKPSGREGLLGLNQYSDSGNSKISYSPATVFQYPDSERQFSSKSDKDLEVSQRRLASKGNENLEPLPIHYMARRTIPYRESGGSLSEHNEKLEARFRIRLPPNEGDRDDRFRNQWSEGEIQRDGRSQPESFNDNESELETKLLSTVVPWVDKQSDGVSGEDSERRAQRPQELVRYTISRRYM